MTDRMRVSNHVVCSDLPCIDVRHECLIIPDIDVNPDRISVLMISEAAPPDPADYYYAEGDSLFQQTTVQAFRDAGASVSSIHDLLEQGAYLTTAVKCGKKGYGIREIRLRNVRSSWKRKYPFSLRWKCSC